VLALIFYVPHVAFVPYVAYSSWWLSAR